MTWSYAYTPVIWPSVVTVIGLLVLSNYSWHRRSVPGALAYATYCLLAIPMLVAKIVAYLAIDFETKVYWFKAEAFWYLPIIVAMTCFALEYARPGYWLTRRNLIWLSIIPLLSEVSLLTNDIHNLSFGGFTFNGSVVPVYGPAGWVFWAYILGLTLLNVYVFGWLFIRSPQHRWPVAIMLGSMIAVRLLTFFESYLRDSWFLYVPEIAISVAGFAIALFRFRILDPIPLARRMAIDQLRAGMLVLDLQGCVVSLNPAAESMFGISTRQAKGKPVRNLLPDYPDGPLAGPIDAGIELGYSGRDYAMTISLLKDWRGLEIGRLLMLHDVTALRQYLATYQDHYGICAGLALPPGTCEDLIDPGAGVQLLRVIQEAMTNARKHGRASCVQVTFAGVNGAAGDHVRITVSDDGCGFDPLYAGNQPGDHFGLAFMRERVEQIGGCLTIKSQPVAGTQVIIDVPVSQGAKAQTVPGSSSAEKTTAPFDLAREEMKPF